MSEIPDNCPYCKQPLWGKLSMESHRTLYPAHFSGAKPEASTKEDVCSLEPKIKRGKRKQKESDDA